MAEPVRNFPILQQKVEDEYTWRRRELHLVRKQIPKKSNPLQTALIRSAIPFLYAHWEGYIKTVATFYLEFVKYRGLKHSELQSQFVALCMSSKINELENNNIKTRTEIINFMFNDFEKRSNIPHKKIINTRSNLKFHVFEEIIFILALKISSFTSKKDLINSLVDARNHIAHGKLLKVDFETYENFHDETISIMEQVKTELENSATLKLYKR